MIAYFARAAFIQGQYDAQAWAGSPVIGSLKFASDESGAAFIQSSPRPKACAVALMHVVRRFLASKTPTVAHSESRK